MRQLGHLPPLSRRCCSHRMRNRQDLASMILESQRSNSLLKLEKIIQRAALAQLLLAAIVLSSGPTETSILNREQITQAQANRPRLKARTRRTARNRAPAVPTVAVSRRRLRLGLLPGQKVVVREGVARASRRLRSKPNGRC